MWKDEVGSSDLNERAISMKKVSPKFVPREWMLVDAYNAANPASSSSSSSNSNNSCDYSKVKELHELFKNPYDENTPEMTRKYYNKGDTNQFSKGGVQFMT